MKRLILLAVIFAAGCEQKETIVVYSPHGPDVLGDYEALFEEAHPEIDVQWLYMGSQEVYSRISAEKGRPAADIWWGAPSTMFAQAAKEGLLAPYKPTWADHVDPAYHDAEHRWYATYRSPLAIFYNSRGLTPEEAPKTWDELLDPKWKGRITLRRPMPSGTMRTFICGMIYRAENEDAGIEWLKQLHAATVDYPESPGLLFDNMKRNEDRISVWLMPDVVMQYVKHGYPFNYHVPPGTPVLTDCIGLVKNAPHGENAKKFYEFVTTKKALAHQARQYAKLPARNDIDPETLPPKLVGQSIDGMEIDWALFAQKEKEWCDRWVNEVYGQGKPNE